MKFEQNAKSWVRSLPVAEFRPLETDLQPVVDTFGSRLAAETLEANPVVHLLGRDVVVCDEEDDLALALLDQELGADVSNEDLSALAATERGVGVHLGDGADVLGGAGDADDGGGVSDSGAGGGDVVDIDLAVGDVACGFLDGVFFGQDEGGRARSEFVTEIRNSVEVGCLGESEFMAFGDRRRWGSESLEVTEGVLCGVIGVVEYRHEVSGLGPGGDECVGQGVGTWKRVNKQLDFVRWPEESEDDLPNTEKTRFGDAQDCSRLTRRLILGTTKSGVSSSSGTLL